MIHLKPITIIGGGLAGLSLGIALRQRNLPVQLHEAGAYPRHRVCGEFIAGADRPLFEKLGIADVLKDALQLQTTLWHCGKRPVLNKRLPTPVTSISRFILDDRLSQLFTSMGGALHCQSRIKPPDRTKEGSVWATGRRPADQKLNGKGWIGLKCHALGLSLRSDLEFFIGRNGYLGMSPVSEDRFNICGLFRLNRKISGNRMALFSEYLQTNGLHNLITRLETANIDPESWCAVAGLDYGKPASDVENVRIGDQLGLIAPLTGNGMSIAFESAALAAPVLERWAAQKISWQNAHSAIQSAQAKAFAKRKRVGRLLQKFLLNPYGQSLFRFFSTTRLVPFNSLYALTHNV